MDASRDYTFAKENIVAQQANVFARAIGSRRSVVIAAAGVAGAGLRARAETGNAAPATPEASDWRPPGGLVPVSTNDLPRSEVHGDGVPEVHWQGVFVAYGGHGADQTTTIVFEIEPGNRLGWHTDQTEETQYIVAGTGELQRDDGTFPVGPGRVFVLPVNVRHDLVNTGTETLRCVGFFGAAMFTQKFDDLMQPPNTHVLGTPNREG
jgi:quercetin dioxygenase-like cupin family protein